MNYKKFLGAATAALTIVIVIFMLAPGAWAQSKYKTLYEFTGSADGGQPMAGLIFDQVGNLYGTTEFGGLQDCQTYYIQAEWCGVVFKLAPNSDGSWTESVLHSFAGDDVGMSPVASLIFDTAGNLYGTTANFQDNNDAEGVVFELTPNSDGSWTENVLYDFNTFSRRGWSVGVNPRAGLIFDRTGSLYGTTWTGGRYRSTRCVYCGVVFKVAPNPDGSWTESTIHTFTSRWHGANPAAGLIFDQAGNLYGTTTGGGDVHKCGRGAGCGVVFKLTPNSDGSWTETDLHHFTRGKDGANPFAGLIFDQAGNLYGTTTGGGNRKDCGGVGCGVVFQLTPNSDGSWTETVLHHFTGGKDGANPEAGLIFDQAGNLYGTAEAGGNLSYCNASGCGVVFKLAPNSKGGWTETVLHAFTDRGGAFPAAGLILDTAGNLYGTTQGDGGTTFGPVFEITP